MLFDIKKMNKKNKIIFALGIIAFLGALCAGIYHSQNLHAEYDLSKAKDDPYGGFKVMYNITLETHKNVEKTIKEIEEHLKSETFGLGMLDFTDEGNATKTQIEELHRINKLLYPEYIFEAEWKYHDYKDLYENNEDVDNFKKECGLGADEYNVYSKAFIWKNPQGETARYCVKKYGLKYLKEFDNNLVHALKKMPSKIH